MGGTNVSNRSVAQHGGKRTSVAATAPDPTTPPARSSLSVTPAMWLPERLLVGRLKYAGCPASGAAMAVGGAPTPAIGLAISAADDGIGAMLEAGSSSGSIADVACRSESCKLRRSGDDVAHCGRWRAGRTATSPPAARPVPATPSAAFWPSESEFLSPATELVSWAGSCEASSTEVSSSLRTFSSR